MPEPAQPGRLVGGRYRLVAKLGAGGYGKVWRARDERLQTDVAIKEVSLPFTLSDAQHRERLQRAEREARNTAMLRDHPNIVTVHDVVVDDDVPWMVMQLVSGRSLAEHLEEHGPLSVDNTAKVGAAVLNALAAAHAKGIVHRDVKPANVMLADDGRVLLTDFGIAQRDIDSSLTQTGAIIGSAEYLAPERARGQEAGPASDLFSLGVTLYQAVEGFSPFKRRTPTAAMTAVLFEQAPQPQRAGRLTPLLAALLEKEPERRASIPQARGMLESSDSAQQPNRPSTERVTYQLIPTEPMKPVKKRSGAQIGLAAAAVVAVIVGATIGITHLVNSGTPSGHQSTTSSSSESSTAPTTPETTNTESTTAPTSEESIPTTTSESSSGPKAGCAEANRDVDAFNASNPAANLPKDGQIAADRQLADNLAADAALATDPNVKSAIQQLSDDWRQFADYYAASNTSGMQKMIPKTTQALGAVHTACQP